MPGRSVIFSLDFFWRLRRRSTYVESTGAHYYVLDKERMKHIRYFEVLTQHNLQIPTTRVRAESGAYQPYITDSVYAKLRTKKRYVYSPETISGPRSLGRR
jgi:hypothetical protein